MRAQAEGRTEGLVSSLSWFTPPPVSFEADSSWRRLEKALKRKGRATATVIGRLDGSDLRMVERYADGTVRARWGYGHMNGFSTRLVVQRVESVTDAPR
jgi:hypothetical protein